ncbi:Sugar kinase of the NBD/HSP70 family, may contain an N-terminal HTH domain [Ruaniaceae bacterium KH17]|nr:Sugar kinase of the NBD/HSP70 family, may contain an N-terminal HTH domain [Ruaniaceae bacterium KH17]
MTLNGVDQDTGAKAPAAESASDASVAASATPGVRAPQLSAPSSPLAKGLRRDGGKKFLAEHARNHNRSLVLRTLHRDGPMSRADLARATGLTRVSISDLVAALIEDRLVEEQGISSETRPGKPAIQLDIAYGAHQIVGIDLSRSHRMVGRVVTLDGTVIHELERPLDTAERRNEYKAVLDFARELTALATAPILGIGIGSPGIVTAEGVIQAAPNLGWKNLPLRAKVAEATGLPVLVANDANASVYAEYSLNDHTADLMLVKIGRGVGAGVIASGKPIIGSRNAAGELGHVVVGTDGGPLCACGRTSCLEAWISVPALTTRLAGINGPDAATTREAVLRDAGRRLGIVLAPVVAAFDLSEIVISGPNELFDGYFTESAIETLHNRTQFHAQTTVRMTTYGEDIVLQGAAMMVFLSLLQLL